MTNYDKVWQAMMMDFDEPCQVLIICDKLVSDDELVNYDELR